MYKLVIKLEIFLVFKIFGNLIGFIRLCIFKYSFYFNLIGMFFGVR